MHDDLLQRYFALLQKWNKHINLTGIDDLAGFHTHHVEDARALLPHLPEAGRVIDLGTGAGLPGVIIKILRPALEITLLDATRKKISFCAEAIRRLDLKDVRAVWGRAEDIALARAVGFFDAVVSRATWELALYLPIACRYMKEGSCAIAMKGPRWAKELEAASKALEETPLSLEGTHPYTLSSGEERCLVVFRSALRS